MKIIGNNVTYLSNLELGAIFTFNENVYMKIDEISQPTPVLNVVLMKAGNPVRIAPGEKVQLHKHATLLLEGTDR